MSSLNAFLRDYIQHGYSVPEIIDRYVVASGFENLGYVMVENMNTTPSGSSVDLVMKRGDSLVGVEVKSTNINPEDLKDAIDKRSAMNFKDVIIVTNKEIKADIRTMA